MRNWYPAYSPVNENRPPGFNLDILLSARCDWEGNYAELPDTDQ